MIKFISEIIDDQVKILYRNNSGYNPWPMFSLDGAF